MTDFANEWPGLFRQLASPLSTELERARAGVDALELIEKSGFGPEGNLLVQLVNICLARGGWPDWNLHFQDAVSIVGEPLATELQREYEKLMIGDSDPSLIQK